MIVLDTHIWVWWVHHDNQLPARHHAFLEANEDSGFGISAISCWEIVKLVEYDRLTLPTTVEKWLHQALTYPGVELLHLTPRIAVEFTQLPAPVHCDPADQIIIVTARTYDCPLMTLDNKILNYPPVQKVLL
ncbi:MAG: type II toxin-antitoxin system VapC family toxin [Abditibacteriaceae bacterium]